MGRWENSLSVSLYFFILLLLIIIKGFIRIHNLSPLSYVCITFFGIIKTVIRAGMVVQQVKLPLTILASLSLGCSASNTAFCYALGKKLTMVQVLEHLSLTWDTQMKFWTPGYELALP